mgnify:CR=1 FL=1
MKQFVTTMQYVFAAMGGAIGAVLGGFDGFLYALIVFVVVDYITGLMAAVINKEVSSEVGFHGIVKKVVIFCLVAVGHIVDTQIICDGSVVRTAVIFFYLSNEGISILENATRIGLPVPQKLKNVLEQLKRDESTVIKRCFFREMEESMKLVQSIMTKNPCYTAGRKITVKGLMLHSVGCPQPNASVLIKNWNTPSYGTACVHGFIDGNDGTVYQTLPWNHRGWHCASGPKGSGNNTHIGVEMCEPASIRYTGGSSFTCSNLSAARTSVKKTYEAAVELFAYLCKLYGLNPTADGVIISHREGHARGIASNHGDPEHLWNGLGMGYTMNTFRKDVKEKMQGGTVKPDETKEMYRVRKSWEDAVS